MSYIKTGIAEAICKVTKSDIYKKAGQFNLKRIGTPKRNIKNYI